MYKVLSKEYLNPMVFKMEVEAPEIANSRKAGHFIIIKIDDKGERIPLTIADSDNKKGSITLIVQTVGVTSHRLGQLNAGDSVSDIVGPLGQATHIGNFGTVLCAGGGVGIAPMMPIAKAMKEAGNRVISVIAARNRNLLILEEEMRSISDELLVYSDDGSVGEQGLITDGMKKAIEREKVNLTVVIGPAIMMKFAALTTAKYNIPTVASLNTIMVDGTGMCGACRITVGGKTKFVCVDGPEFDAHQVDFDEMITRLGAYKDEEKEAYEKYIENIKQ